MYSLGLIYLTGLYQIHVMFYLAALISSRNIILVTLRKILSDIYV